MCPQMHLAQTRELHNFNVLLIQFSCCRRQLLFWISVRYFHKAWYLWRQVKGSIHVENLSFLVPMLWFFVKKTGGVALGGVLEVFKWWTKLWKKKTGGRIWRSDPTGAWIWYMNRIASIHVYLGGGNSNILYFPPAIPWENDLGGLKILTRGQMHTEHVSRSRLRRSFEPMGHPIWLAHIVQMGWFNHQLAMFINTCNEHFQWSDIAIAIFLPAHRKAHPRRQLLFQRMTIKALEKRWGAKKSEADFLLFGLLIDSLFQGHDPEVAAFF